MKPIILLDNGHGIKTHGKRSPVWPDGSQLFEFEFNRDIVSRISRELTWRGIKHERLVPEIEDIPLYERCKRANMHPLAILISVHANAGGGTGFEVFTSKGNTKADPLAEIMLTEAKKELSEFSMRGHKESQFYILKNTIAPAILTENLFMDTYDDCMFLMSEKGRNRITKFHVNAIIEMLKLY